jgi:hypothetical protein
MMRTLLVTTLLGVCLLNLGACSFTEGVKPDAQINTAFVPGVSTLGDVEARLGQPMKVVTNSNGTMTATFHYGEAHLSALAFTGVGAATGQDITTTVTFDAHGRFVKLAQQTDNRRTAGF